MTLQAVNPVVLKHANSAARSFGELAEEFTANQGQASEQDSRASGCGSRQGSEGDVDGE